MLKHLEGELKDLKDCESFSFLNVTETDITNDDSKYVVSWIVEVSKIDNNKRLKIEFNFSSIIMVLFFIF
jgi:hypothetical protein